MTSVAGDIGTRHLAVEPLRRLAQGIDAADGLPTDIAGGRKRAALRVGRHRVKIDRHSALEEIEPGLGLGDGGRAGLLAAGTLAV